jgi:hypothetical protein
MRVSYLLVAVLFAVLGVTFAGIALYLLMILIVGMLSGDPVRVRWQIITLPMLLASSWLLFKGFRDLWLKGRARAG